MRTEPGFFVVGGTIPPDGASYVVRATDELLFESLVSGEYCYVLNSRQMGKSSLCVRTMARLAAQGVRTVFLDLTKFGASNVTAEQWYAGMLFECGRALGLRPEMARYWQENSAVGPMERLFGAIREIALPAAPSPLALFVDEIDVTRSLKFSADEFFAGVRQCYVGRATTPDLARLTVCLLGTATPSELIQDTRTSPFNIGRRIDLTDFTLEEAMSLASELGPGGAELLRRIHYWTNGHPYLTQRLCREVAATGTTDVDRVCDAVFLSRTAQESDDNLAFVRNRLLKNEVDVVALLDLFAQLRKRSGIPDDEAAPLVAVLKMSGVCRRENGRLRIRNRIYERVFDRAWVQSQLPDAERLRQRAAYRRGVVRTWAVAGTLALVMGVLAGYGHAEARTANSLADSLKRKEAQLTTALDLAKTRLAQANRSRDDAESAKRVSERERLKSSAALKVAESAKASAKAQALLAGRAARGEASQRRVAQSQTRLATDRLDRQLTAQANDLMEAHDPLAALHPLAEALKLEAGDPERQRMTRLRLGYALGPGFALRRLWVAKGGMGDATMSPDGTRIAVGDATGITRIWDVESDAEVGRPMRSPSKVIHVIFSPDGKRVATASEDGSVGLWNAGTGDPILDPTKFDESHPAIAFSPDGKVLAAGSGGSSPGAEGAARLMNGVTGATLHVIRHLPKGIFNAIEFSPDGRRIAVASSPAFFFRFNSVLSSLWVLDTKSGQSTTVGISGRVSGFAAHFSPDGRWLAVAGTDGARLAGVEEPWKSFTIGDRNRNLQDVAATVAVFAPEGRDVIAGNPDGTSQLWNIASGQPAGPRLTNQTLVTAVAISANGKLAATAYRNGSVTVWNPRTGEAIGPRLWTGGEVFRIAFDRSFSRLFTASWDGTARVWEVAASDSAEQPTAPSYSPYRMERDDSSGLLWTYDRQSSLRQVGIASDGSAVAYHGNRAPPGIDISSLAPPFRDQPILDAPPHRQNPWQAFFDARTVQVWNLERGSTRGKPIGIVPTVGGPLPMAEVACDGSAIAICDRRGSTVVRDLVGAESLHARLITPGDVTYLYLSPEGRTVFIAYADGRSELWRTGDRRRIGAWRRPGYGIVALGATRSGRILVGWASSTDSAVQAIDTLTGRFSGAAKLGVPQLGDSEIIFHVISDSVLVITGRQPRELWDMRTLSRLWSVGGKYIDSSEGILDWMLLLSSGKAVVNSSPYPELIDDSNAQTKIKPLYVPLFPIAVSPDGLRAATKTAGKDLRIWNCLNKSGAPTTILGTADVEHVDFSPDGELIATSDARGGVRVWAALSGVAVTPTLGGAPTRNLKFGPNGNSLFVGRADGVRVVSLPAELHSLGEVTHLAEALDIAGNEAWTYKRRAALRDQNADKSPLQGLQMSPPRAESPSANERDSLETVLRTLSFPADEDRLRLDEALISARLSHWDDLMANVSRLAARRGYDPTLWYLKGLAQEKSGDLSGAETTYSEAARSTQDPNLKNQVFRLARLTQDWAPYARCFDVLGSDVSIVDTSPAILAYSLAGQLADERRLAAHYALSVHPNVDVASANDYVWWCAAPPGALADYGPTLVDFEKLVRASPSYAYLNTLGVLMCRAGHFDRALSTLREGVRMNNGIAGPSDDLFIALCEARLGHRDAARAPLGRARTALANALADPGIEPQTYLEDLVFSRESEALAKELGLAK